MAVVVSVPMPVVDEWVQCGVCGGGIVEHDEEPKGSDLTRPMLFVLCSFRSSSCWWYDSTRFGIISFRFGWTVPNLRVVREYFGLK